jgi:hypothetical protein
MPILHLGRGSFIALTQLMINLIRSVIAAITLVIFSACSTLPISEDFQKSIIRQAKDKFFSSQNHWDDGSASWKPLQDQSLNRYVATVGEKIRKLTQVPQLEYVVVDTPTVQAVSSYGISTIYVTLGMLNSIQNEAELACLLGHEIHHQEQFLKNPNDEKPHSFAKDAYDNLSPEEVHGFGISKDIEDISYSNYSKNKETDADEQGSVLCGKAGYESVALSSLQERIAAEIESGWLDHLKNLKGTHDELIDRSVHLKEWLNNQGIKEGHGKLGIGEYAKAFQKLKPSSLTSAQKTTLQKLSQLARKAELLGSSSATPSSAEIIKLTSQLSKIVKREKITPKEIASLSAKPVPGDHFMQEQVVNPFNRYGNYHDQVVSQVFGILEGISRIALGFTPLGAVIDFHDVVTGTDFFTGEQLSQTQRVISAIGLVVGQGHNLRELEGVVIGASAEVKALLRSSEQIVSSEVTPVLGNRYVRSLPHLTGTELEATEGHIFQGSMQPGEIVYQAQRTGQTGPGRWFTPVKPLDAEHAEEMLNINKWTNDGGQIKAYRFKETVSGYASKVEGGSGHQFKIPKDVPITEVLEEIPL